MRWGVLVLLLAPAMLVGQTKPSPARHSAPDDPTGGGEATWDLNSRSGKRVASGVYFYHIETPDRRSRVGRFTVITGPRRGP